MFKTSVFRFLYFDRARDQVRSSADYATRKAMASMGVDAIEETERLVDARIIGSAGLVMLEMMPGEAQQGSGG